MKLQWTTAILECGDMETLIGFYSKLLGWPVTLREEDFILIKSPETGMGIAVQFAGDYIAPVWPSEPGRQQMMAHLDFSVTSEAEMKEAAEKAVGLGARIAETQYGDREWVTLLDPAGHPFCIVVDD